MGKRALHPTEPRPRPPARPAPSPAGWLAGGGACAPGLGTERGNVRAASLRLSRRAEAVAAGPRGLAVGGERNAGARRAPPPPPPDKCFFCVCARAVAAPELRTLARCKGCERPPRLCQEEKPSAVDLSQGRETPPGAAE